MLATDAPDFTNVSSIKGVGPAWARKLTELGIKTVEDLLLHFPFRFDLRKQAQPIASLKFDGEATIAGEVISASDNSYTIEDQYGILLKPIEQL